MTGEFPAQRASDAENVSIWWRHHVQPAMCATLPADTIMAKFVSHMQTGQWVVQVIVSHYTETLPYYWPFVRGLRCSLVDSPFKMVSNTLLMFSLSWASTKCWTNCRVAGNLKHRDTQVTSLQCHGFVTLEGIILSKAVLNFQSNEPLAQWKTIKFSLKKSQKHSSLQNKTETGVCEMFAILFKHERAAVSLF